MEEKRILKLMKIEIVDRHFDDLQNPNIVTSEGRGLVHKGEFRNIELDEEITESDFERALDVLYTFMVNKEINNVDVNLKFRDFCLRPNREMTLDEISDELNANVTLVAHKNHHEEVKNETPEQIDEELNENTSEE